MMDNFEWIAYAAPAIAALVGFAHFANRKDRKSRLSLRLEGIRTNRLVKQLMINTQMHRGMVSAFLSGDKSFRPRIEQKQTEIDRDIASLDPLRDQGLMTPARWEGIKRDWQGLRKEAVTLSLEDSFHRHSDLIRGILYTMGDVAGRSQIAGASEADAALVNALWSDLPSAAEGVGQARGLGTGVAAKGYCAGVARIKLRFLEERIRETMAHVNRDLASAGRSQSLEPAITQAWDATDKTVHEFLAMLEKELINAEQLTIAADHYFSASTKSLDAMFKVFDQASDALEKSAAAAVGDD